MKSLAQALAIATAYISARPNRAPDQEDDDVRVLEDIAAIMQEATKEEVKSLAESATKLAEHQSNPDFKDNLIHLTRYLGLTEDSELD